MQVSSTHLSYYTSRAVDEYFDPGFYGIKEEECVFLKEVLMAIAKKNKEFIGSRASDVCVTAHTSSFQATEQGLVFCLLTVSLKRVKNTTSPSELCRQEE